MDLNTLQHFNIPPEAMVEFSRRGLSFNEENGVASMSGTDGGIAYKFIVIQEEHAVQSEILGYKKAKAVECVQWFVDRKNRPVERIKELPESLLRFNKLGECVGGKYKDAYIRFKQGEATPGLSLKKWSECSDADLFTLEHAGIFSVEQLAENSAERIHELFGGALDDLHAAALGHVQASKHSDNSALLAEMENLKRQLAKLMADKQQDPEDLVQADITEVMDKAERVVTKKKKV